MMLGDAGINSGPRAPIPDDLMHALTISTLNSHSKENSSMATGRALLKNWFLVSGCMGILVALALGFMAPYRLVSQRILLVLWPFSIIGLADPSEFSHKIIFAAVEFGGNFILYGAIGTLIGLCFRRKST